MLRARKPHTIVGHPLLVHVDLELPTPHAHALDSYTFGPEHFTLSNLRPPLYSTGCASKQGISSSLTVTNARFRYVIRTTGRTFPRHGVGRVPRVYHCNPHPCAVRGETTRLAWTAEFAAPLFWRNALTWHSRLPLDVRQDWIKLEPALYNPWPFPVDDNMPQIHPTPAAAPLLNHKDKANHPLHGFLKIVDRSNTSYYVKPPQPEPMSHLSSDSNGALRVRCNSLSRATLLGRIDHSCLGRLYTGARLPSQKPNLLDVH